MKFSDIIEQASDILRRQGRVSYRTLKIEFDLSDDHLDALKEELIEVKELATDKDGKMLVWTGGEGASVEPPPGRASASPTAPTLPNAQAASTPSEKGARQAERRQLTVMFCDLVGSTALSEQLDPEDLQAVVRTYQEVSAQVIERYGGYIAQYLGDGLLVYFGYPTAHEDDAARSIRAGLEIVAALKRLSSPSPRKGEGRGEGSGTIQSPDSPHPSPRPKGAEAPTV